MQQLQLQQAQASTAQLRHPRCLGRQNQRRPGAQQASRHVTAFPFIPPCSRSVLHHSAYGYAELIHLPRTACWAQSGSSPTSGNSNSSSSSDASSESTPTTSSRLPSPASSTVHGQPASSQAQEESSPVPGQGPAGREVDQSGDQVTQQVSTSEQQQSVSEEELDEAGEEEPPVPFYKRPLLTWALVVWTWWLFVQQWLPLWPALTSPCPDGWAEVAMRAAGICLALPPTEVVKTMQMDMAAFLAGNWATAIPAAFLHSGFAPTLLFSMGLLDAGQVLEKDGPLMMGIQVALAACAAGLAQSWALPSVPATITGPGMVCGLHMAVAARATYSLHQARQLLKEDALSNPEQDADPLLQSIVQMVLPSKLGVTCLVVGLLLGLYIPNLSAWGVLGGMAGGLLGAATAHWVIIGVRFLAWLAVTVAINLLMLVSALPVLLLRLTIGAVRGVANLAAEMVETMRR